jgi:hypothetical protein
MNHENVGAMGTPRASRVIDPNVLTALSCSLPAADADTRRVSTANLFDKAIRCDWTPDGARVLFHGSTEMAQAVMEFVLVERTCCADLTYQIETMPPHDHVALVLRGPKDLRDAIRAWVGKER